MKWSITLFLLLATVLAGELNAQSLWKADAPRAVLIGDNIARQKGDILSILINESQKVQDNQNVKLEKDTSLNSALTSFDIDSNAFDPLPNVITQTEREFEGKSNYNKEGSFTASISVIVIDVQPNGNLIIEGKRNIFMDDEEKTIQITGIIRPLDITTTNTVTSDKVAEASVSYVGDGPLTQNTERNWLDSLVSWLWPF